MSAFPDSPRLIKGGIVLIDPQSSAVLRVAFQDEGKADGGKQSVPRAPRP